MKPVDVKPSTYIDSSKEINVKDPKFKIGDIYIYYVISDPKGEEIVGTFYEKELQKTNQKDFRVEKVIKRKDDKLYVKSKGYDNSFNSEIDKKDIG